MRIRKFVASAAIGVLGIAVTACSEPTRSGSNGGSSTTAAAGVDCVETKPVVECAPEGSMLAPYLPDQPERATESPIRIGTINQDTGAAGAFPLLTTADKVAIDFINTELGGIEGHPIELLTCNTHFNPDLSQSCAQEMVTAKVPVVVGGIDIWGTGITTLEKNGIPYVGGIPVSFEAARSPISFQFSGGTWGAVLGMGQYAMEELGAKKIAIIYGDFGPITDSARLGKEALERQGATVTLVATAPVNPDMVTALNEAAAAEPDAVIALTADSGCKPVMLTAKQIGLEAPLFLTGACIAPKIVESVGDAAKGRIFNVEAVLEPGDPDNELYRQIATRYGAKYDYPVQSEGTVSFRSVINLYVALREIGYDNITPQAILAKFRAAKDAPSFFGHPYTCNGEALPGYPALCAPQQTLGRLVDGQIEAVSGWIDVGSLLK
ncbi:MAG: ABC transporter substrate-binding protein [Actinomycetota bacterium]